MVADIREIISGQFNKIIDVLHEGYILVDEDANIIDANPAYCSMVGYTKDELLSMSLHEVRPGMSEDFKEDFIENVEEEGSVEFETQHRTKTGEMIDLNASAGIIEIEGKKYLTGFVRDITKQKEAERKLNAIFNSTFQFIGLMKPDGTLIEANQTALEFGGLDEEEVLGKPVWDTYWWQTNEETKEELKEAVHKAAKGEFIRYEVDVKGKGESIETIDFSIKPVFNEQGEVELLIPEGRVITEKKKAERKLKETANRFQSLFNNNPQPVYYFDLEGNFLGANKRTEEVSGYPEKELLSMNFAPIIVEEDLERTQKHFLAAASGSIEVYEIEIQTKQKEIRNLRVTNFPMKDGDEIIGVFGIAEDITEAKLAKKKLEESQQRFQSLFEYNPNAVYSFDLDGSFVMANEELEVLTGYTINELKEMNFEPLTKEGDRERVWDHFSKAANGKAQRYEATGIHKKGHKVHFHITNLPIYVNDEIVGVFGIAQDITEQKNLQAELKKSEQRWQHLVEDNPQPVQVTVDGDVVFINQAGAELYGAPSPEEIVGKSVFEFTHPDFEEKITERKHKFENGLDVENVHEHKIIRLDGKYRFVEVHSIPIDYKGQKAIQTVLNDITIRKRNEQVIKDSLNEKEVLLQEIHHRVKNNMAVISGLLQLQAMSTEDEALNEVLKESQMRISSMAMIHEKLYESESFSDIGFDTYIKELVETIQKTVADEEKEIRINYDLDEISLNINQAIPCALILNELVVNSFKHAFPKKVGTISIALQKQEDNIKISVSDDGVGLPKGFDLNELQSLGMTLVQTLALQLEGQVEHGETGQNNGTEFVVTFPLDRS